jgi:predicted MFS family arabinose efflux permease
MSGDVKSPAAPDGTPESPAFTVASLLAVGAMVVATATPYLVGVLAPFLTEALLLSPTEYGLLASSAYLVAVVASRPVGALTDSTTVRTGLTALMTVSCISWVGLSVAQGFWTAVIAVSIGGMALAASNPLTNRMVAESRPRNYGFALGVKQAGVPLSAFLMGAVAPTLATSLGWRAALLTLAPVPVALTAVGYRHFRGAPRPEARRAPAGRRTPPTIRRLTWYAGLMGAGGGMVNAYVALFAVTALGSTRASAGFLVALIGAIGIVARICWASLSQSMPPMLLLLVLAGGAVVSAAVLFGAQSLGPAALLVGCFIAGLTSTSWLGVAMVAVFRLTPGSIGASTGSVSRAFYLGLLVAPVGGGVLLQRTEDYRFIWAAQAVCFAAAFAVAWRARADHRNG